MDEHLTWFCIFGDCGHVFLVAWLTWFGVLGFMAMYFWDFDWLDLEFWDLWSCIFRVLIDLIWSLGIYSQKFTGFFWLYLGFLGIVVMCFWWLDWLDLEFWDLWPCIFGILIDLIWSFGIYGHVFLGFWLTWFGVWEFTVKNLPGFFDCIWDFWICSQQSSLFLMTYIEILQYEVNLSLCFCWFILNFCNI